MWRSLVRVVANYDDSLIVVVPGWEPNVHVTINKANVPAHVRELEPGTRCYARVNLGAESLAELQLAEPWELS